ncbi:MAG TPA: hypothetical protein VKD90_30415, partial [Gemmataceae bacterium]|nr:hypothetical protein [Gemmataceae bacterium]
PPVVPNVNTANRFTKDDVRLAWDHPMGIGFAAPVPGRGRNQTPGQITDQDKPFRGTAIAVEMAGQQPGQNSQDRTYLKRGALWQRGQLTPPPNGDEDYDLTGAPNTRGTAEKYEMLSKTFGHLTTRSNTFAVWMTIGYFEVLNDGPYTFSNRPILGKELGTDDGTSVRHKFFAVIDRTNLAVDPQVTGVVAQGPAPVFLPYHPNIPLPDAGNGGAVIPEPNLATGIVPPNPPPPGMFPPDPSTPAPGTYDGVGVEVRIPAVSAITVGPAVVSISGYYDGQLWTLTDGRLLGGQPTDVPVVEIDIGGQKELAVVQFPPNNDPMNPVFNPATGTARIVLRTIDPVFLPMPGAAALPAVPNPAWQSRFLFNHHRGAAIRLLNRTLTEVATAANAALPLPRPGNPGPQAAFQHNAPRYTSVVKYAEQVR